MQNKLSQSLHDFVNCATHYYLIKLSTISKLASTSAINSSFLCFPFGMYHPSRAFYRTISLERKSKSTFFFLANVYTKKIVYSTLDPLVVGLFLHDQRALASTDASAFLFTGIA